MATKPSTSSSSKPAAQSRPPSRSAVVKQMGAMAALAVAPKGKAQAKAKK